MSRHRQTSQQMGIRMGIQLESPSLVFHGTPDLSNGALLVAQVKIFIDRPDIKLESFTLTFLESVTYNKPVVPNCTACRVFNIPIKRWASFPRPRFGMGGRRHRFSYHVQGIYAGTSHCSLGSIEYVLQAHAVLDSGAELYCVQPLEIRRALKPVGDQTISFYYTTLQVGSRLTVPFLIHSTDPFNVRLQLWDLFSNRGTYGRLYRLSSLIWRIEEHTSITPLACRTHGIGGSGLAKKYTMISEIGSNMVFRDAAVACEIYDTHNGLIVNFQACISHERFHVRDFHSRAGLTVSHLFVVEVVFREFFSATNESGFRPQSGLTNPLRIEARVILAEKFEMDVTVNQNQPPLCDHGSIRHLQSAHPAVIPPENAHRAEDISGKDDDVSMIPPENAHPTENISGKDDDVSMIPPENVHPAQDISGKDDDVSMIPPENAHSAQDISGKDDDVSMIPPENAHSAQDISGKDDDVSIIPPQNIPPPGDNIVEPDDSSVRSVLPPKNIPSPGNDFIELDDGSVIPPWWYVPLTYNPPTRFLNP